MVEINGGISNRKLREIIVEIETAEPKTEVRGFKMAVF